MDKKKKLLGTILTAALNVFGAVKEYKEEEQAERPAPTLEPKTETKKEKRKRALKTGLGILGKLVQK